MPVVTSRRSFSASLLPRAGLVAAGLALGAGGRLLVRDDAVREAALPGTTASVVREESPPVVEAKIRASGIDIAALSQLRGSSLLVELLPVLPFLTQEDFRAFADSWVALHQSADLYDVDLANLNLILRYWAARFPKGLEQWLVTLLSKESSESALARKLAFQAYLKTHPEAALAWAATCGDAGILEAVEYAEYIPPEAKRRYGLPLSDTQFARMALEDPASLAAELANYSRKSGWGFSWDPLAELARGWAQKDPAGALAWAESLPEDKKATAFSAMAEHLPIDQVLSLRARRPKDEQYGLGWSAVQRLRQTNPLEALRLAAQLFEGDELARVSLRAKIDLGEQDPERAMTLFRALGWPEGGTDLLLKIAEKDPARAYAEVAQTSWNYLSHPFFYALVDWGEKDYDAALAWAVNAPLALRQESIRAVVASYSKHGPDAMSQYAHRQPPGAVRDQAFSSLMEWLSHKDQPRIVREIASAPPDIQARLASTWYADISAHDTDGQLLKILQQAPLTDALRDRYEVLANHMPVEQASRFLEAMPPEALTADAWSGLTERWSLEDPVQASDWVARLPSGAGRDSAVQGLITGVLADGDPAAAWQWAGSVAQPELRATLLEKVQAAWQAVDPAAAAEAANTPAP